MPEEISKLRLRFPSQFHFCNPLCNKQQVAVVSLERETHRKRPSVTTALLSSSGTAEYISAERIETRGELKRVTRAKEKQRRQSRNVLDDQRPAIGIRRNRGIPAESANDVGRLPDSCPRATKS